MLGTGRILPALLTALLLAFAQAGIGEPPERLLAGIEAFEPAEEGPGYAAANDLFFDLELRGGLVYRIAGSGVLDEENLLFLSALVGEGTGGGEEIAQPVAAFLEERAPELAGLGISAVGVGTHLLALEVTGAEEPYLVSFELSLPEVPTPLLRTSRLALGPEDAPFVVRKFSDFQCPFCASFALEMLPEIEEELLARGDVRFEFHHLPLRSIHANAAPAAEAAECVFEESGVDGFWEYHDALFDRQRAWSGLGDPYPYFARLAGELGLEGERVGECLDENRFAAEVDAAYRYAAGDLGLSSTPTLLLNGYRVGDSRDISAYLDLIELITAFAEE